MQNIFHQLLLIFSLLIINTSIAQSVPASFCGKIENREPFLNQNTTKTLTIPHYKRAYRRFLGGDDVESKEEVGLGTRIAFDKIPDHLPDVCKECEKPNGNCGVGLKCICHPKECSKCACVCILVKYYLLEWEMILKLVCMLFLNLQKIRSFLIWVEPWILLVRFSFQCFLSRCLWSFGTIVKARRD